MMREGWKKTLGVLFFCLSTVLAVGETPIRAEEEPDDPGLVQLTERTWAWIARDERSSNGALFVGEREALLVDPGLTPGIAREFLAAASAVTDRPIRQVVLTHWHPDHAQGVSCLTDRNFRVISHPLTRRSLAERGARVLDVFRQAATGEAEKEALHNCRLSLPDETIAAREEFDLGSHLVQVFHPGPAHTRGDLVVWSPSERVLVTGDLFLNNACPSMGEGSTSNWVASLDELISLKPLHVVPGHFDQTTRANLSSFRNYLAALLEQVKGLMAEGVAPEDVGGRVEFPEFASFLQFPRYGATFADNAAVVAGELARRPALRGERAGIGTLGVFNADILGLEVEDLAGRRPFPPAATSDGRLAFIPNYDDGTVTIVDLWNERVLETVQVGLHPGGGVVLPGDKEYAVAVRGQNQIVFINTASHRVVSRLEEGIGNSPFSVVLAPGGRLAFVNNTESHDISVIDLDRRRVIARVPVGEIPIAMAVHPSGKTLWVSSEGSHEVTVLEIPPRLLAGGNVVVARDEKEETTEVVVLGMIHGRHRTSQAWGLDQVRATIRRLKPQAVCAEIPPDRWERIWKDFTERGVMEDDRITRFPEYTDVLLPLSIEMGFEIIPCAGWTREMSDLRQERMRAFQEEPEWAAKRQEYDARLAEVQARYKEPVDDIDDPRVIHGAIYDDRIREELSLYDEYLNEWIGPGGWTHINEAHMRLIDEAIRTHRGQRLLITFGAGHKYWFLDRLGQRKDVRLLDPGPFPGGE